MMFRNRARSSGRTAEPFHYRLSSLLILVTAMAVGIEMGRALAGASDGLFFIGLAFAYPGAAASAVAVGLGYAVGGRPGATITALGALLVWLGPIWLLYAADASAPRAAHAARWFYTVFALMVCGATLWSVWREEPAPAATVNLEPLRRIKHDLEKRTHPGRDG
jgi:hypothetical protein